MEKIEKLTFLLKVCAAPWVSLKNQYTSLGAKVHCRQGAQAQEYRDISALGQHGQAGSTGA
jgi:hypothetical protein